MKKDLRIYHDCFEKLNKKHSKVYSLQITEKNELTFPLNSRLIIGERNAKVNNLEDVKVVSDFSFIVRIEDVIRFDANEGEQYDTRYSLYFSNHCKDTSICEEIVESLLSGNIYCQHELA